MKLSIFAIHTAARIAHRTQQDFSRLAEALTALPETDQQGLLEIDVVESAYIPPPLPADPTTSRLHAVEHEKQLILEELRKLDAEIAEIRGGEGAEEGRRKEKAASEEEAKRQAKELVRQLQAQKREAEERRKKETERALAQLKQEEEERRKRREEEEARLKEEKRRAIEGRLEAERRKREERKLMDKESNKLLVQLRKEEEILKLKEEMPPETLIPPRKAEKRAEVNFREIEEHEKRYLLVKEQERQIKQERSESQPRQVHKYQKNAWTEKLEEEEFKKREEEKLRELQRKAQLEKRLKYGQLVKNIFLPKKKDDRDDREDKEDINKDKDGKPFTPDAHALPRIPDNDKRITEGRLGRKFHDGQRPFATAHNPHHNPHHKPATEVSKVDELPEQLEMLRAKKEEEEKVRKLREAELRKETKERLRKLENQSLDLLPQSKPKYENYLGQVKLKKREETESWQRIFEDKKLSKEEKYSEMLKKASAMESKAKLKEQLRQDGDEDAVNLYIGSIQAKLALLEKF